MKKGMIALILFGMMLCSCTVGARPATDVVARAVSDFQAAGGAVPAGEMYFPGAEPNGAGWLEEGLQGLLYYGEYRENEYMALLSDYAIFLSQRPELFEVHILRARNRADVKILCEMLENRGAMLKKGDMEQFDYGAAVAARNATVFSKGDYAVLIVCEEIGMLEKAVREALG